MSEQDLALQQFIKALAAFEEAIANDDGDKKSRDSLLLSYVFTFEMACRSLKTTLEKKGLDTPNYGSAILKAAFQARLITDAVFWETLRDYRNNVSHAYDEGKAIEIAAFVGTQSVPYFKQLLAELQRDA